MQKTTLYSILLSENPWQHSPMGASVPFIRATYSTFHHNNYITLCMPWQHCIALRSQYIAQWQQDIHHIIIWKFSISVFSSSTFHHHDHSNYILPYQHYISPWWINYVSIWQQWTMCKILPVHCTLATVLCSIAQWQLHSTVVAVHCTMAFTAACCIRQQ